MIGNYNLDKTAVILLGWNQTRVYQLGLMTLLTTCNSSYQLIAKGRGIQVE